MNKLYKVGIYCRLSVDDASNSAKARNYIPADESVSIENQRELLSKFAMLNGWVETKTYCDDGYSGGNFQRAAFLEMLEDAKKCWFTACLEDGVPIPEPARLEDYSGQFKLRLPKSLHKQLAQRSSEEGVSMNQYCVYLLSKGL